MSMAYIRDTYHVPAKRGGTVEYTDHKGQKYRGTILSAPNQYLRVKLDGVRQMVLLHPTWNIVYDPEIQP